jgi:hypothetical protein
MINAYTISVRKPEGKKPVRRSRCTWENTISDLKQDMRVGTELVLLRISTSGRLF